MDFSCRLQIARRWPCTFGSVSASTADALTKGARRLTEPAFEAAREIELVAEIELGGDFFNRVSTLMEERGGAIDARIEMKSSGRKADGFTKLFPKRLIGETHFLRDHRRL